MNIVLFDDIYRQNMLPLTYTRPQADIRIGILTVREKWEKYLHANISTYTRAYLSQKFPMITGNHNLFIAASYCPNEELVNTLLNLQPEQSLMHDNEVIAHCTETVPRHFETYIGEEVLEYEGECTTVRHCWDIYAFNEKEIQADFELLTKGRVSQPISPTNAVLEPQNVFIEEGVEMECAIINAKNAKVYIGENAIVMEGTTVRGSMALCEGAQLKMGTKIYGATTIGPYSKVGGEIANTVIFGYSNKAHDGFLGNSVLGEWCNLGANTNTSNLKNNYEFVRLWNYAKKSFEKTNQQFCGLIMGDHSKSGISVMFNTGTVVGVSANVFGAGYQRNFFPSFHWGGGVVPMQDYKLDAAIEVAKRVYERRNKKFTDFDSQILYSVHNLTEEFRKMDI
ncbi:MAG: glucose-1-phosphate thymidylyltransferase [Bacteroidales bacterium]|jgi:UDP-N-acetylglucosamine diphosphorylase/glucosamine-1-phosphate N-acetyltransferase|nr:glucose-1-phosphate thymidylyltransferase [Bacteroidales bacterium]